MMMAVAGLPALPGVIVPGGVTLPPAVGEDAGTIQTLGARFAQGRVSLEEAAELGCRACASPGGGCQFLGTAATSQVVAEALGLSLPHAALAPSGQPVWLDMARRSARALVALAEAKRTVRDVLTPASLRNAMALHAAFGGSTNLLLHVPAIAHAAGLAPPVGRGLDRGESPRAAAGQRPAERSLASPHGAGLPGRRRAGGDAAPATPGPDRHGCPHRHRPHARREPGLVGAVGAPAPLPRAPAGAGRRRGRRGRLPPGAGPRAWPDDARWCSRAATSPPRARW